MPFFDAATAMIAALYVASMPMTQGFVLWRSSNQAPFLDANGGKSHLIGADQCATSTHF
ncbi:hypothetical protein BC940DRAFT_331543 [Gongronella butleri]|nr:hypothetical protein BC940DRAFT_331543 [Gongronella butleri]